jgi:uncharacterized membrane protein YgdD (TMEM256/DUF423 family)
MNKSIAGTAAILGAISVALGAFAAHGLKKVLDSNLLSIVDTAVTYQFYHVFALLAVALSWQQADRTKLTWAARLFLAGILLFCGSLYALVAVKQAGYTTLNWIAAITPVGGVCFIVGWLMLALAWLSRR